MCSTFMTYLTTIWLVRFPPLMPSESVVRWWNICRNCWVSCRVICVDYHPVACENCICQRPAAWEVPCCAFWNWVRTQMVLGHFSCIELHSGCCLFPVSWIMMTVFAESTISHNFSTFVSKAESHCVEQQWRLALSSRMRSRAHSCLY